MKINILIIDDEQSIRELLSDLLSLENHNVLTAADASQAVKILRSDDIHLVITDVKLPDKNGIELISEIKQINPNIEIIVLTAFGTILDGVKAMREGAFDYIVKGDEDTKIIPLVRNIEKKFEFIQRIKHLENKLEDKYTFDRIVGNSPSLLSAINLAKRVADSDVPVLLLGETGTGKEIFARAIHFDGYRKHKNFIALNCSSFSKDLLETEMFGYKAGAFTGAVKNKKGLFEEANGGTIFLDEIGDLDFTLQSKLLRVLETGSFIKIGDTKTTNVDARIIAATNKNLESAIKNNLFRADLFYRISAFQITLPPLRTRKEDIPDLVRNFVDFYSVKFNKKINKIDDKIFSVLSAHDFPGNTRELKNIIERIVLLSETPLLSIENLPYEYSHKENANNSQHTDHIFTIEQLEKEHISKVLTYCDWNKTKAAELLGIGLTTLYRKIESYHLGENESETKA